MRSVQSGSPLAIGVDVGGSKIAGVAIRQADGAVVDEARLVTPATGEGLLRDLAGIVDRLSGGAIHPVGIALPAPVDGDGQLGKAPNLPGLQSVDGLRAITNAVRRSVVLGNDAKCAALAEAKDGAGQGYRSMLLVAVGTGVGAGYVLDGCEQSGPSGAAGEIGHLEILPGGELCGCGRRGCAEAVASGLALGREAERLFGSSDGRVLVDAASAGHEAAGEALEQWSVLLVRAVSMATFVLDPEVIVLGGGVFDPAEPLLSRVRRLFEAEPLGPRRYWPPLVAAALGNRAAAIGAARMAAVRLGSSGA